MRSRYDDVLVGKSFFIKVIGSKTQKVTMSTAAGVARVATFWAAILALKVFAKDASTEILVDEKYPKLKINQSGAVLFAIKASL